MLWSLIKITSLMFNIGYVENLRCTSKPKALKGKQEVTGSTNGMWTCSKYTLGRCVRLNLPVMYFWVLKSNESFLFMKITNEKLSLSKILEYFMWPCWTWSFHYCVSPMEIITLLSRKGRELKRICNSELVSPEREWCHCFLRL